MFFKKHYNKILISKSLVSIKPVPKRRFQKRRKLQWLPIQTSWTDKLAGRKGFSYKASIRGKKKRTIHGGEEWYNRFFRINTFHALRKKILNCRDGSVVKD